MTWPNSAKSSPRKVIEVTPRGPRRARRSPRSASPRGLRVLDEGTLQEPLDLTQRAAQSTQKVDLSLPRLDQTARLPPCDLANSARSLGARNLRRELEGTRFPTWSPSTPPRRRSILAQKDVHVLLPSESEKNVTEQRASQQDQLFSRFKPGVAVTDVHEPNFDSVENLIRWAKRFSTTIAIVKKALAEFRKADENGNGALSLEEFKDAVRYKFGWSKDQEFPEDFVMKHWKTADSNNSFQIDFSEYLNWAICTEWNEHAMVPDQKDRQLRQLSRDYGLPLPDVEHVRQIFDKYDIDKSDSIEENEFKTMICELTRADKGSVSAQVLKLYWREVDKSRSSHVAFAEFVSWWFQVMCK